MNITNSVFLAGMLAALLGACASTLKTATPSTDYFLDAQQCNRQTQEFTKLKINFGGLGSKYGNANVGGGAADIPIALGMDQRDYRVCMESKGWKADPGKDPYIALIDTCRNSAMTTASAQAEAGGVKISGGQDQAAFDECMRSHGVTGTIIVLPLKPEPPNR